MVTLNDISREPFAWGTTDCCATAARVAAAITGRTRERWFRYSTEGEADKVLATVGGLEAALVSELGPAIAKEDTRDGDVLLVRLRDKDMAAVRLGDRAVCRSAGGMLTVPMTSSRVVRGWRID